MVRVRRLLSQPAGGAGVRAWGHTTQKVGRPESPQSVCPEDVDLCRVLELCILHDLAEVRVGDITPHDNVSPEEKHRLESEAIENMGVDAAAAFSEYEAQQTPESRFVRYLDKLDMSLQAEIYESEDLNLSEFKQEAGDW